MYQEKYPKSMYLTKIPKATAKPLINREKICPVKQQILPLLKLYPAYRNYQKAAIMNFSRIRIDMGPLDPRNSKYNQGFIQGENFDRRSVGAVKSPSYTITQDHFHIL